MRNDRLYLADMLDAIEAVERFTTGMDESRFVADELVQSAVLQKLLVIGEAAGRVQEETRVLAPELPWRDRRLSQRSRACVLFRGLACRVRHRL
jgi:uncharacterized protein with HEPN domain